jgi:ankyrin repeat protein
MDARSAIVSSVRRIDVFCARSANERLRRATVEHVGNKPSRQSSSGPEGTLAAPRAPGYFRGLRNTLRAFVDPARLDQVKDDAAFNGFCAFFEENSDIVNFAEYARNAVQFGDEAAKQQIANQFLIYFPAETVSKTPLDARSIAARSSPRVPPLRLTQRIAPDSDSPQATPRSTRTPRALVSARSPRALPSPGSPRALVKGESGAIKKWKGWLAEESKGKRSAFIEFARGYPAFLSDKKELMALYKNWSERFEQSGSFSQGLTALMYAVAKGDGREVMKLLKLGVDPRASQNWISKGETIAENYRDPEHPDYLRPDPVVDWVVRDVPGDRQESASGTSAVTQSLLADADGPIQAVAAWIEEKPWKRKRILRASDANGMTPLTACVREIARRGGATRANRLERLNLLFALGASINQVDENGDTPLTAAIKLNDVELIDLLIARGAKICCLPSPIAAALACEPPNEKLALDLFFNRAAPELRKMIRAGRRCAGVLAPALALCGLSEDVDAILLELVVEAATHLPKDDFVKIHRSDYWLKLSENERRKIDKPFYREPGAIWAERARAVMVELREFHDLLAKGSPTQSDWGKVLEAIADLPDLWGALAATGLTSDLISDLNDMLQSVHLLWKLALGGEVQLKKSQGAYQIEPSPFSHPAAPELMACFAAIWRKTFENAAEKDRKILLDHAKAPDFNAVLAFAAEERRRNLLRKGPKVSSNLLLNSLQRPLAKLVLDRNMAKAFPTLAPLFLAVPHMRDELVGIWHNNMSSKNRAAYRRSIGDSAEMKAFLDYLDAEGFDMSDTVSIEPRENLVMPELPELWELIPGSRRDPD